jgi:lipopolysaccharide/colanic/teichoic acid biosynthesis glycosyltransferase
MKQAGLPLFAKRTLDRAVALVACVATAPVLATAAAAVRLTMGAPVLFTQPRGGHRGRVFHIVKLRTMKNERGPDGELLPDAARLTGLGRFLRATSIDELPQLWNVLRGDLSLVGPRPFMSRYLPLYSQEQMRRHDVLPGITGWAQIHGRNALSWEEKFALDLWYVDHWSFGLDLRILAKTALAVVGRVGIAREGEATMPDFQGSEAATNGVTH